MSKSKKRFFKTTDFQKVFDNYNLDNKKDSFKIKLLIIASTIALCTFFFTFHFMPKTNNPLDFNTVPGYIWPGNNIIADYSFPIYKSVAEYNDDLSKAEKNALQVFKFDPYSRDKASAILKAKINQLQLLDWEIDDPTEFNYQGFDKISIDKIKSMSPSARKNEISKLSDNLADLINFIYKSGYVNVSVESIPHDAISVRTSPNNEAFYKKTNLFDAGTFREYAREKLNIEMQKPFAEIANQFILLLNLPNMRFSQELTEDNIFTERLNVPKTYGVVRTGETIVKKGQRVTKEILEKLKSYERSGMYKTDEMYSLWIILGSLMHAVLLYSVLLLYLFFIRKRIFHNNFEFGILNFTVVIAAFLAWLTVIIPSALPLEYFVMLPALSMLVAIVFDSRTAFYTTVVMALLLAGIRGNDYDLGIAMLISGTLAAYTVRDIQSRTQIYKSIFFIFLGLSFAIFAIGLERSTDFAGIGNKLLVAAMNSAISPLLTFGMLFILERTSFVTTDLKLEEFNNLNHPLIVRLNEVAPGTYQHTLTLSMLAEKCAQAIGANPLLAKVGAYFHDVGKMAKPEFFGENQIDARSKHELITPKKSAEAIKFHVSEGVKFALDFGLPQRIVDFIPMHHGTTLIQHFYAKAIEIDGIENVNETDFRYPGPKPRSKETAIVMICDSSEALSRLESKDKAELEKVIAKSIKDKLLDGQFDESNLTLKDLNIIKDTCVKNLLGISHPRSAYKEIPKS